MYFIFYRVYFFLSVFSRHLKIQHKEVLLLLNISISWFLPHCRCLIMAVWYHRTCIIIRKLFVLILRNGRGPWSAPWKSFKPWRVSEQFQIYLVEPESELQLMKKKAAAAVGLRFPWDLVQCLTRTRVDCGHIITFTHTHWLRGKYL